MSIIGIAMNLILAGLLLAALVVGIRLNRRLTALRDSHQDFETAVRDLNLAAQRAEQGLADLRAATDEATDTLSDRIEKGRALASKLDRLIGSAPELPQAFALDRSMAPRGMPAVMPVREAAADQRLTALLAAARARIDVENASLSGARVADEPRIGRAPLPGRRVAAFDEDIFEDGPATGRLAGVRR